MNSVDVAILLGVLFFVVLGYRDGFFKKIYGIIGFWAGLIVAAKCMYFVGQRFADIFQFSRETSHIIAFAAVFMIVVLLENLFYRWFGTVDSPDALTVWARLGGVVIGFMQGLVAVSLLLIMFTLADIPSEEARTNSTLYAGTFHVAPAAFDLSTGWIGESKGFLEMLQENFHTFKMP